MSFLRFTRLLTPWRKLRLELEKSKAERDAYLLQRDQAIGERNAYLLQRDQAIGERNEYLRQRDVAIGQTNMQIDRVAVHVHRADIAARRHIGPAAGTRDRILLFLHLARTGGLTLADILSRNFEAHEFLKIEMSEIESSAMGTWSHRAVERALGRMQDSEVENLRAVWGHYGFGIQSHLPKPCACVTILRSPIDRLVSAYYYEDHHAWRMSLGGPAPTLEDYASRKPHDDLGIDNYMTRVLGSAAELDPFDRNATTENRPRPTDADFEAAATNLERCMVVGVTDSFDETLLVLGSDLRWSLSDLVYAKRNATETKPTLGDIPKSVRDKLMYWNQYDAMLIERARAHLARRIATYRGDFQKDLALFRQLNTMFQRGAPIKELRRVEHDALA
jgi:hypothetical protein